MGVINGTRSIFVNLQGSITETPTIAGRIESDGSLNGSVSVSTKEVPYYEVSNEFGGTTIYIGKEILNNGI